MGISFKVSKTGKRFQPKPLLSGSVSGAVDEEEAEDAVISASTKKTDSATFSARKLLMQGDVNENKGTAELIDTEVSFTLSLFPDGYSIAKPKENESASQTPTILPKSLLPYDRASETLFSAIESGRLPADILDDIPGKYIDGTLFCEVRDYRKCFSEGLNVASGNNLPIINRVSLRMSLENIVKDIPAILDDDWTYGDMMEVESRILKALQPKLCLNPTPQLDRLSHNPVPTMLSLEIRSMRRKRQMQILEVAVSSNNVHGKKIYVDRVPESSRGDSGPLAQQLSFENLNIQGNVSNSMLPIRNNSFGLDSSPIASPLVSHQSRYQIGPGSHKMMRDQRSGSLSNMSVASPGGQDMMIPFTDNNAASIHDKRDTQDGQPSPHANKKARLVHTSCDGNLQNIGPQVDNLQGSELHWKNTLVQQQPIGRGIQYTNNGMQKFSQQFEGGPSQEGGPVPFTIGQQGIRYKVKEELVETERLEKTEFGRMTTGDSEINIIDTQQSRLQQRMPHQFMRSSFPQTQWNNLGQPFDNNSRKEDSVQKRKLVQSPRVNAGGLPQSPLSSKSGEISSGSMGPHFGSAVTSGLVQAQKEKSAVTSFPSVGVGIAGNPSFTTSANDSIQRQNLTQASGKRRSNSLPKTPVISGVGSPASVSNISLPINVSSPPVGTQPPGDQAVVERFSKIEIVSMRYQINFRKKKMDEYPIRKPNLSTQQLASIFSNDSIDENLSDETCKMPLSKSLIGGNVNVCKTRILNFTQTERIIQGNGFQIVPKARTRMIMSEKPNDGSVAIHIGDIEDAQYLAAEDYLPTLPNTYAADLLAAQFCSLMVHEGYHVEDHVQPRPVRMNPMPVGQLDGLGIPPPSGTSELHQLSEGVSIQAPNDNAKPSTSGNTPVSSSQNVQVSRMLHPGHPQAIQMSQGLLPGVSISSRPQQPEQLPPIHQQPQQQQQQFQRSPMMLPANSMQHLSNMAQNANMQLGSHMTTKPSALQLQMLQQHQPQLLQAQQQQQQSAMQRKMMTGLGTVGMGNIGSNIVGLGGLGNVMGIGGARGVGGTGISAPMGSISSMGNMNQNPMSLTSASSLSNAIRAGTLTAAQANYMKMRMAAHSRNMLGNSQSSIGGISGARQMLPGSASLSMLGPALNRTNMNQLQRASIGQMGPPKIMPGMNLYMNQQQLHMQQQQQMHMQQQQQQLQQAQEASSPLPAVVSSPQVGSPSCIGVPHQMNQTQQQQQQSQPQQQASPQQMSQRTPMSPQLSSGVVNPMTASNAEACPASPQLSSQTLGSVGGMSNSPMELQGVNKSNSLNNLQGS